MEMSQLNKKDSDDYLGFATVVNKNCDDFKLGELSADNFKCLIFAQGLVLAEDAEIIIPVSLNGITKKLSLCTEEHRKFVWVGLVSEI